LEPTQEESSTPADLAAPQRAANVANLRLRQALHMDFLMASDVGCVFAVGWVDDSQSPLTGIRVDITGWSVDLRPEDLARVRRPDVDAALGGGRAHSYGFWAVTFSDKALENGASCKVSVSLTNGAMYTAALPLRCCTETQLRATVVNFLGEGQPGYGTHPGEQENLNRLLHEQRNRLVPITAAKQAAEVTGPSHTLEFVGVSDGGGLMVTGWVDDRTMGLECLRLIGPDWKMCLDALVLGRSCRVDVDRVLQAGERYPFAFWAFAATGQTLLCGRTLPIELQMRSGAMSRSDLSVRRMTDIELRATMLSHLASAQFAGNQSAEAMLCLDPFIGQQILDFNLKISREAAAAPYVERLRPARAGRQPLGSIVVCLYGKPEFLFLQAALFSGRPGIEGYEFVYVCNSPELAERLLKEARIAVDVYGVEITLVLLAGNAGFGAANNAGVAHCRSDRILIINPDVFPRDPDWAARHTALIGDLPREQTQLFGVPLYYDDGSLMHGGMYFEMDTALAARNAGFEPKRMIRVEHYGKGAPPGMAAFVQSRPVAAVTGAFISCDRAWFESLGGFTEDYVFGHYEDADLCMKSLQRGTPAWLHDVKLWHLEGKGSTRLPVHEGGSLVNRWLFSKTWGTEVRDNLLGPTPSHPLLHRSEPAPASVRDGVLAGRSAAPLQAPFAGSPPPGRPAASMAGRRAAAASISNPIRSRSPAGAQKKTS